MDQLRIAATLGATQAAETGLNKDVRSFIKPAA